MENISTTETDKTCNSTEAISTNIIRWIEDTFGINNAQEMINDITIPKDDESAHANVAQIQEILEGFNMDIRNMYDNYVCFHGVKDARKMNTFLESAYQRAKHSWKTSDLVSRGFSENIVGAARSKLFLLYDEHNKVIIINEVDVVHTVVKRVTIEYKTQLQVFIDACSDNQSKDDFAQIHKRMIGQCNKIVGLSLRFGGKLNNVVLEATKGMVLSLNDYFDKQVELCRFPNNPTSTPSELIIDFVHAVQMYDLKNCKNIDTAELLLKRDRFIDDVTVGCDRWEKEEVALILDSHWSYAQWESNFDANNYEAPSSQMGIYLTQKWTRAVVSTQKHGNRWIPFRGAGSDMVKKIPTVVAQSRTRLKWGYKAAKLKNINLFQAITNEIQDTEKSHKITSQFIQELKEYVQAYLKETIDKIFIVIPSWLTYSDNNILRKSILVTGFKKIVMMTESSLAAYWIFRKCLPFQENHHETLVLIAIVRAEVIRLEIFGCSTDNGTVTAVKLLAVMSEMWTHGGALDSVCTSTLSRHHIGVLNAIYGIALNQLETGLRNSVKYYQVISEVPKRKLKFLDRYLTYSEKLEQVESNVDKHFLAVFSSFSNDSTVLRNFLHILATSIPLGPPYIRNKTVKSIFSTDKDCENENLEKRNALIEKCNSMEAQMTTGWVQVGKLTRRIILDAIVQGRLAAGLDMVDGVEAREINELFKLHKFK